jgi:hypothetical protein
MLTTTKVQELDAVEITAEDIKEILAARQSGVCRAVLSPCAARLLLESHNGRNRGLKRHQKHFLRGQIESGKFAYNGESIVIGDDNQVMNGQHRLTACAESGLAIEVLMVFGVPADAFVTIDQGARRSGSDVLSIEGHKNCVALAGCLRQVDNYFHDSIGKSHAGGNSLRNDNAKFLELLGQYPDVKESVAKMLHCKLTPPSLAAALHYLFAMQDKSQADEFCDVIVEGVKTDIEYSDIGKAAAMLREWLMRQALGHKSAPQHYVANVWIKAWNAGRSGVFPKVLIYKDLEGQVIIR